LQQIVLNHGGTIPSIEQVLKAFPNSKINIDVKAVAAISDLARVIKSNNAQERVLLTSFSENRRIHAVTAVPGVATSPSASLLLRIWFSYKFGIGLRRILAKVDALQIPVSYGVLRFDSPKFIRSVKRHDVEVFYWTINEPAEALRLQKLGANGIVTDRTDLMFQLTKP
jgi:glycerophosphoryl diester phosphodiesterase